MNRIFRPYIGKFVLVYLDDILVFSKTESEHLEHLRKALTLLREHQLYAKLSKCDFGKTEVEFLGHILGKDGLRVDPKKTAAVRDWQVPKNVGEVRSFLGLANYFRKFIRAYSNMVAPLTNLTRKDTLFAWSASCQVAFDRVKEALTNAPVLRVPDVSRPFEVICDASGIGLGAVLMQDGQPVAFESRKFNPAERNYAPIEQELLGVIHALGTWRCYLEGGGPFVVVTDHKPNTFFQSQPRLSPRQVRWMEFLSRFHFTWQYRPGHTNVADPLSRDPSIAAIRARLNVVTRSRATQRAEPAEPVRVEVPESDPEPMEPEEPVAAQVESVELSWKQKLIAGYSKDPWFAVPANVEQLHLRDGLWFKDNQVVVPDTDGLR